MDIAADGLVSSPESRLAEIAGEAAQILEIEEFRQAQVIELSRLTPGIEDRWRKKMIAEYEAGDESDPEPDPGEFRRTFSGNVFRELKLGQSIINSSALVMAHSFFDALINDLLAVTAIADQTVWEGKTKEKKVRFDDVSNKRRDEILQDLIELVVKDAVKESLTVRMALLIEVCHVRWDKDRPKAEFNVQRHPMFTYDASKLSGIDQMRHEIVHRKGLFNDIQGVVEDSTTYLWLTLLNSIILVADCFQIPVDPNRATASRFAPRNFTLIIDPTSPGPGSIRLEG